ADRKHTHEDHPRRLPIGFAHRGGPVRPGGWRAPDNTLSTFRTAYDDGAPGIESDVRATSDNVSVLFHDANLASNGPRIDGLAKADLPDWVPTIADFYATVPADVEFCVDVLDPSTVQTVLEAARAAGAPDRLWLVTSWPEARNWRAEVGPEPHLVAGLSWSRSRTGFTAAATEVGASDYCTINMEDRRWNRRRIADTHHAGLLAFGWRAVSATQIKRLVRLGADGIYSDTTSLLVRLLPSRPPSRVYTASRRSVR
ncbi:MAG: glycerophosphodiester phosphodiesterase, partial [Mycobacteriales bacterium]